MQALMRGMYEALLEKLDVAIVKRNHAIGPLLQPGLPADLIRKDLKRHHVAGYVEPIVELYAWHDSYAATPDTEAYRLGFAPPTFSLLPAGHVEFLQGLGQKVDPNRKIWSSYYLFRWDYVVWHFKHWKKFAPKIPRVAPYVGRVVPFLLKDKQTLALDVEPSAKGRVISIQDDSMKNEPPVREAYASFEEFLLDMIRANETDQAPTWPTVPGNAIELPIPLAKESKTKKATIPAGGKVVAVRTDFSDDAAWEAFQSSIADLDHEAPVELDCISDPQFKEVTPKKLPKLLPASYVHSFAMLVDQTTLTHADRPVLIVDLLEKPGQSFRVAMNALNEVHANLSIANTEFGDFAGAVDKDGIFRGF